MKESYTTNLCQKCLNNSRVSEGKGADKLAVERVRGAKGAPWKALENDGKRTIRARNVGILLPRKILSTEVPRAGRRRKASRNTGSVAAEPHAGENLEQVKSCNDTDCTHRMMKQGFVALRSGDWEEFLQHFQRGSESHGMGLLQNKGSLRAGGEG